MILYRYILKMYYKYVAVTLLLCLFLFMLFDFIHKATSFFNRYSPEAGLVFQFYLYQMPFQLMQGIPLAALFAGISTMVILNKGNEITAMRAVGLSVWKIAAPLFVGGISLTLLMVLLGEYVIPSSAKRMNYIRHVRIEGASEWDLENQSFWVRDGDHIVGFSRYNQPAHELEGLQILTMGASFRLQESLQVDRATYRNEDKTWILHAPRHTTFTQEGLVSRVKVEADRQMSLPLVPDKLRMEWRMPDEMSERELDMRIAEGKRYGANVLSDEVAWHVKMAFPFSAAIVSLLGLPFGYASERKTETLRGILGALGIGISYWFMLSWLRAMAVNGDMPPMVAAWMGNVVVGAVVLFRLIRLEKSK